MVMPKKTGPKITPHSRGGFRTTITVNGEQKHIYGKTEKEVLEKYIKLKYLKDQGYNIGENPTLRDYAVRWFNVFKKGKGAIKTQEMYVNALNVHIIPALGRKRIREVTTSDIQQLLNETASSKSLQHKIRMTLKQIFDKAQADRLIAFNPVVGTNVVKAPDPVRFCYSPEQLDIMIKVLQNDKIFPLAFSILNTGMRVTEAIALMRKRDLELDKKIIHVRESTEFVNSKPRKKPPKTKRGVRDIPISSAFADWLEEYLKRAPKSLYVFPGHDGGQMGQTELKNMQRRANDKLSRWFDENPDQEEHRFKLHFRALRHTYCTELFDLGVDEVSAAAIMGHTVSIMREIYTHIQKERQVKTVQKIESLYSNVVFLPKENRDKSDKTV